MEVFVGDFVAPDPEWDLAEMNHARQRQQLETTMLPEHFEQNNRCAHTRIQRVNCAMHGNPYRSHTGFDPVCAKPIALAADNYADAALIDWLRMR